MGRYYLKWLVEALADRQIWKETDHKENTNELNGPRFAQACGSSGCGPCSFISLVKIGRNHSGDDVLSASARKVLRSLVKCE
jgi:hypothetical protein